MIRTCIHCDEEFDDRKSFHKKGKINECGNCAGNDVPKYIGTNDAAAKSGSGLNIFRTPAEINTFGAILKAQCRAGCNANLGLGSVVGTSARSEEL